MRAKVRRILLAAVFVFAAIQLVPVDRSNPPAGEEVPASPAERAVLRRACYNCHSNETVWPWYSRLAPVSWLVASDVHEGRGKLDFSTWNRLSPEQRIKKRRKAWKEVSKGEMPPWYYRIVHTDASLSPQAKAALRAWALRGPALPESRRREEGGRK